MTGKHHPFSDIDILYVPASDVNLDREVFKIKENIEESNFPTKVDLVNEIHLAKSDRESVMSSRIQV